MQILFEFQNSIVEFPKETHPKMYINTIKKLLSKAFLAGKPVSRWMDR